MEDNKIFGKNIYPCQLDGGARAMVSLSAQEQVHLEKKYKLLGIVASQIEPYFEDCVWGS